MALVHLKQERRADGNEPMPTSVAPGAQPDYSYGLRVNLQNNELDKLKVKQLPRVGEEVIIHARAKVARVSESSSAENKGDRNVEFQITHMELDKGGNVGQVKQGDKKANVGQAGKTDSAFAE